MVLMAGFFVGAFSQAAVSSTFAIILCAVCKTIVTIAFFMNRLIEEHS